METLFVKMLNMSITASYAILAVLLIRLLLKRAPKQYAYILWAVVLFRLVSPVSFTSEFSLFNAPPFDTSAAQQAGGEALRYVPADIGQAEAPRATSGIPAMNAMVREALPAASREADLAAPPLWVRTGAIVWCAGAVAWLMYGLAGYVRLRRRLAAAVRLEDRVYETEFIRSPIVLGFWKPRIYLPYGLNGQERSYILEHEAYHLRRKDHLIKLIAFLALAVHWFNPFVWLAFALMAKDMEMSCDEKVLSKIGMEHKKPYCEALLSFAANRRFPAAGPLAFGEAGVRERVVHILSFKRPSKGAAACLSVICIAVIAACAANPAAIGTAKEAAGEPFGHYRFVKQIYMNPLSSFIAHEGFEEYYTLTENALLIADADGNTRATAVVYNRTEADADDFRNSFIMETAGMPDIASYHKRYRYDLTAPSASPGYRLYLLDDELWLAKIHTDLAHASKSEYIWSIYQIEKTEESMPAQAQIAGTKDGVDAFLALHKELVPNYYENEDACYNITPRFIREYSGYNIFKYADSAASYLLYDGVVYPLGIWSGGIGASSMALADLDGDDSQELYFTYSWGSGLHRSQAAYFDPSSKQVVALGFTHLNGEMLLTGRPDGSLSLFAAEIAHMRSYANFEMTAAGKLADIVYLDGQVSVIADRGK